MAKKTNVILAGLFVLFGSAIFACIILIMTGAVTFSLLGLAVDSSERIYIGKSSEIQVYEQGVMINSISPKTSRSYAFTINKDDKILLSTSTKVYLMDLSGNVIEKRDDLGAQTYNELQYGWREFVSPNGNVYKVSSPFGWTRVVKNNSEIVYRISPLSYAVKVLIIISVLLFFVLAFGLLSNKNANNRSGYDM